MKNYITLTFWNRKNNDELRIQINKSDISTLRLYNITNTLRLINDEYVSGLVVNQFHIIAYTENLTDEILNNYVLEEISITENEKLSHQFSVKYDNPIRKVKYENNVLELLEWYDVKSHRIPNQTTQKPLD